MTAFIMFMIKETNHQQQTGYNSWQSEIQQSRMSLKGRKQALPLPLYMTSFLLPYQAIFMNEWWRMAHATLY